MANETIILFRGRKKSNGQWVEGNYHHNIRKGKWHGIVEKETNDTHQIYLDSLQVLSVEDKWIDATAIPSALHGHEGEERTRPSSKVFTPVESLLFLVKHQATRKNGAAKDAHLLETDLEIIESLCNDFEKKHLSIKEPKGRSLQAVIELHTAFEKMSNEQQISFMLLYIDEINVTFDNDTTSFFFTTEDRIDCDVTVFYLNEYLDYRNLSILFKLLGAKANAV